MVLRSYRLVLVRRGTPPTTFRVLMQPLCSRTSSGRSHEWIRVRESTSSWENRVDIAWTLSYGLIEWVLYSRI
jgi:hypothetical protein